MVEKRRRFGLIFGGVLATLSGLTVAWHSAGSVAPWSDTHDEYFVTSTADNLILPIYRFKPDIKEHPVPVILCHGLGANRYNMMAPGPANLARWLADKGHDVFVVELRGAGKTVELNRMNSVGGAWDFDFDTYARLDGPALMKRVSEITGSDSVDWVGHSMGGMLSYALAGTSANLSGVTLRRAVSVAGPAMFDDLPQRTVSLLSSGVQMPFARLPNEVLIGITQRLFPWAFQENDPAIGFKSNYETDFVRGMMKYGTTSISRRLAMQFFHWHKTRELKSMDGNIDYLADMNGSAVAFLFLSGSRDLLTPKASLRHAFDAHGGEKKLMFFGRDEGHAVDYGHGDIILGQKAPEEVYPHISEWLLNGTAVSSSH